MYRAPVTASVIRNGVTNTPRRVPPPHHAEQPAALLRRRVWRAKRALGGTLRSVLRGRLQIRTHFVRDLEVARGATIDGASSSATGVWKESKADPSQEVGARELGLRAVQRANRSHGVGPADRRDFHERRRARGMRSRETPAPGLRRAEAHVPILEPAAACWLAEKLACVLETQSQLT